MWLLTSDVVVVSGFETHVGTKTSFRSVTKLFYYQRGEAEGIYPRKLHKVSGTVFLASAAHAQID